MRDLFYPSSVVVIGVSERPFNLGKEIARNLLEFRFNGVVHLVGAEGGVIFGRRIHKSLDEILEPVDLAVILTPARTVPDIMEQCGRKGIRRAIIESGGFGEYDDQGRDLGKEIKNTAEKYGMRFIGPNCIGIMNAANGLATPFAAMRNVFRKGGVAIIAQSGGVGLTFLNMFDSEQLGYSKFAAIGNKLNIDENDLLEYCVDDPETTMICLYLESIKDGRRLADIGRRSSKPIIVHKANIADLSRVIAQSHTEALANDDQVVDAAFHQSGIARIRDMQGYLDFLKILQLPPMKGRNLAIVSRSGGHAVIAADAAHMYNFQLPPFRQDFLTEIRKHLRADVIRLANPLDLGDLFDFDVYVRIIDHTLQEENVDGILFLHTYFAAIEGEASRRLLHTAAALSRKHGKPVALCVSTEHFEISRLHKEFDFPIFMSPERAVAALDASIKYRQRRDFIAANEKAAIPQIRADEATIRTALDTSIKERRAPLLHEALDIIRAAGLAVPEYKVVDGPDSMSADVIGFAGPYAVKVIADGVSHKSDLGGVVLGLSDLDALRKASTEMADRFRAMPDAGFRGLLVQEMVPRAPGSYELIIGGKRDPQFGPVLLLGHGGIMVEVFARTTIRLAPVSAAEAEEMIEELPGSEVFRGIRGRPPINSTALRDSILTISNLLVRFPEISSLDVNPLVVSPKGALALDARVFCTTEE